MNFRPVFVFLIFAVVLACAAPVRAQTGMDPIGKIIEIEGTASRQVGLKTAPFKIDDDVYANDIIVTGPASRALIMFIDDTQITLGEDANMKLDKYVFDPEDTSSASADFNVLRGSFLLVSGLLTKNQKPDVHVRTSFGTIGLRGTTVWGGILDDDYGVLVQDGEVDVVNKGGATTVPAGQGTFMKNFREKPRPPQTWTPDKTGRAVKTIALARQQIVAEKVAARKTANVKARKALAVVRKQKQDLLKKIQSKDLTPEQRRTLLQEYKQINHPSPRAAPPVDSGRPETETPPSPPPITIQNVPYKGGSHPIREKIEQKMENRPEKNKAAP